MKKIEKKMCEAVKAHKNWHNGNTEVYVENSVNGGKNVFVYLHGNRIYERYVNLDGTFVEYFSLAGWDTVTTRSRLRALGIGVRHVNGWPMYNNHVLSSAAWYEK